MANIIQHVGNFETIPLKSGIRYDWYSLHSCSKVLHTPIIYVKKIKGIQIEKKSTILIFKRYDSICKRH